MRTPYVTLYKITYNFNNKEYYSEQVLPYRFVGGLKVNYMTYLQGKVGAPILRLTDYIPIKIDGEKAKKVIGNDIFLDELPAGRHTINIRGFRDIQITFKESNPLARVWMNESNRWYIDKYNKWEVKTQGTAKNHQKALSDLIFRPFLRNHKQATNRF